VIKTTCEMCGKEIINPKIRAEGHFICNNPICIERWFKERMKEYKNQPEVKKKIKNDNRLSYQRRKKLRERLEKKEFL